MIQNAFETLPVNVLCFGLRFIKLNQFAVFLQRFFLPFQHTLTGDTGIFGDLIQRVQEMIAEGRPSP